jgi:hypothetical protein
MTSSISAADALIASWNWSISMALRPRMPVEIRLNNWSELQWGEVFHMDQFYNAIKAAAAKFFTLTTGW